MKTHRSWKSHQENPMGNSTTPQRHNVQGTFLGAVPQQFRPIRSAAQLLQRHAVRLQALAERMELRGANGGWGLPMGGVGDRYRRR